MPYKKRGWIEVDYRTKAMFQAYKDSLPEEKPWNEFMKDVFNILTNGLADEDKDIMIKTYIKLLKSKDFT